MFTSELSALAMLRWHEGFNAAGGGGTGFLIGAMAAALLVFEYRLASRANAGYATCKVSRSCGESRGAVPPYLRLARQNELRLR